MAWNKTIEAPVVARPDVETPNAGPTLATEDEAAQPEFEDLDIRLLEVSVTPFGYATDDNCGSTCGGTACASGPA